MVFWATISRQCYRLNNVLMRHVAPVLYCVKPAQTGRHCNNAKVWQWCHGDIGSGFDLSQPPFHFLAKTHTHASTKAHFSAFFLFSRSQCNSPINWMPPKLPSLWSHSASPSYTCSVWVWMDMFAVFSSAALSTHTLTLITLVCMQVYTTLIPL